MLNIDPQWLSNIALSDFSVRLLILLGIMLLDQFIALSSSYHPKLVFRYLSQQLAAKVNSRSATQQKIAGQITLLVLISLTLGFTWLIMFFAVYPWFFQFIILGLLISSKPLLTSANIVKRSLENNHKVLAREQLQQLCLRDTKSLSTLGIAKATIEALPQRLIISYFSPILIYACFGIYATVLAVTVSSAAQIFNQKHLRFFHYGMTANLVARIIIFPAQLLFSLNIYLLFGAKTSFSHIINQAKNWHTFGNGLIINVSAWALNCSLGGAVIYQKIKITRPQLGTTTQPSVIHINDIIRVNQQVITSWLGLIVIAVVSSLIINTF